MKARTNETFVLISKLLVKHKIYKDRLQSARESREKTLRVGRGRNTRHRNRTHTRALTSNACVSQTITDLKIKWPILEGALLTPQNLSLYFQFWDRLLPLMSAVVRKRSLKIVLGCSQGFHRLSSTYKFHFLRVIYLLVRCISLVSCVVFHLLISQTCQPWSVLVLGLKPSYWWHSSRSTFLVAWPIHMASTTTVMAIAVLLQGKYLLFSRKWGLGLKPLTPFTNSKTRPLTHQTLHIAIELSDLSPQSAHVDDNVVE